MTEMTEGKKDQNQKAQDQRDLERKWHEAVLALGQTGGENV